MKNTPDLFVISEHAELLKKLKEWDIAYHQNDAPVVDEWRINTCWGGSV